MQSHLSQDLFKTQGATFRYLSVGRSVGLSTLAQRERPSNSSYDLQSDASGAGSTSSVEMSQVVVCSYMRNVSAHM